ncbi:MAG: heme lyase CcmF/NrfE family subunit [Salibacteraceae bacterium]
MEYIGEHLLIGKIGNLFIIIAFISALFSSISYFIGQQKSDQTWVVFGRRLFFLHGIALIGIVATLFTMILNQYFEYHYVWQHSSSALPLRYIFSCFWEGQEGSFLLWAFWHIVLGLIFIRFNKKWEAPVISIFALVQAFITSMLLGSYFLDYRLGSNPFTVLLRDHPDFANIPLFSNPEYLTNLDGRGLNPLLQNYWMTIHPPTLFLGFASTLTPFALAIAGLWTGKYKEWIKPAIPWTFFSVFILGLGILMGGAWAYEALSFGGFWAWDPVENASLVPWLVIIGAGHLMLIEQKRGGVMKSLIFLTLLSFILVLYSTFLTRSGILGDASVHAFTDLGMSGQLLLYLLSFVGLGLALFFYRIKSLPNNQKEEELWSREFWMFIGSLVLFVSSFQITFSTSLPVINKIFGTDLAPSANVIEHYNSWQTPFVIVILIIMAFSQFLNYKSTPLKKLVNNILTSAIVSLVLAFGIGISVKMSNPFHLFMLFASFFTFIANVDYWLRVLKGKIKYSGASIAHAGFGLMMLGILISMSQQENISTNTSTFDVTQLGENFTNKENILLMEGDTLKMGEYFVTYTGREKDGVNIRYLVNYFKDNGNGQLVKDFTLKPQVQLNERMGNVPEPDTRHFLTKDIYTHVTWAVLEEADKHDHESEAKKENLHVGDTLYLKRSILIVDSLQKVPSSKYDLNESDIAVEAVISVWDFNTERHILNPVFVLEDTVRTYSIPAKNEDLGLDIEFNYIYPENGSIDLMITEDKVEQKEFIVMQAIMFPYINLLWLGSIIMFIGTIIAVVNRLKLK